MFGIKNGKHGLSQKAIKQGACRRRRLRSMSGERLLCERLENRVLRSVSGWDAALVDVTEADNDVIISASDADVTISFESLENQAADVAIEIADAFVDDMMEPRDGSEIENNDGSDEYGDYLVGDSVDTAQGKGRANLNVALVDATLADHEVLTSSFNDDVIVIEYDGDLDSAVEVLEQVNELSDSMGVQVDSLSIMSHGSTGQFKLGSDIVTSETLGLQSEAWAELGENLTEDGNIYLFGCNVRWQYLPVRL